MNTNYCNAVNCIKKKSCNHYLIKEGGFGELIGEDLQDLCLPSYRLYIKGSYYKGFPNKHYYEQLIDFYDNVCPGESCGVRRDYPNTYFRKQGTPIPCKLGEKYICKHQQHPDNVSVINSIKLLVAENEAFEKAGITEGKVEYTCPICGCRAIGQRRLVNGKLSGFGSGCPNCGVSHS